LTPTSLRRSAPPARERSAAAGADALYDAPVSEPHIRKVRPDELEEVWRVHVASSNDLLVRRGRPATRPAGAPVASHARAGLCSSCSPATKGGAWGGAGGTVRQSIDPGAGERERVPPCSHA